MITAFNRWRMWDSKNSGALSKFPQLVIDAAILLQSVHFIPQIWLRLASPSSLGAPLGHGSWPGWEALGELSNPSRSMAGCPWNACDPYSLSACHRLGMELRALQTWPCPKVTPHRHPLRKLLLQRREGGSWDSEGLRNPSRASQLEMGGAIW